MLGLQLEPVYSGGVYRGFLVMRKGSVCSGKQRSAARRQT